MSSFTVDIELTNRCNAKCSFCPRDATPHQGMMSPETFDQALLRAVEYQRIAAPVLGEASGSVSLCGLGEPLLNKHAAAFARQATDAGFQVQLSSNGALLDERRSEAMLDAGLKRVYLNVGERDEAYEAIYQLPFEKTRRNVVRFAEMAEGLCDVYLVLVDAKGDPAHVQEMKDYWAQFGIQAFVEYELINRGGALFVDHMQFETLPELEQARGMLAGRGEGAICGAPFAFLFVGYDANYYLCCSDWTKAVPLGTVFDASFADVIRAKLERVITREPICKTCNLDPHNQLTEKLRAVADGDATMAEADALAASITTMSDAIRTALEGMAPGSTTGLDTRSAPPARKLIPLQPS